MIYGTCRGGDLITGVEESDDGVLCATQLLERTHFGWLKRSFTFNSYRDRWWAVGMLVVRASDSRPSMRKLWRGEIGGVAIYQVVQPVSSSGNFHSFPPGSTQQQKHQVR
ncbi:hypothetical protein TNCV_156161 [Trichonephila clavipes]|nr:hypothetical protein TNCV_156161 [Trichonephila clavipes]